MTKEQLTGAELVIRGLEYLNVSTVFGVPGGAILPAYDPLYDSPIRHILARHEQGAGHMAEGYAQATGELGVVIATSGPGATNLITPLANALMDSTPLLAITGQVASTAIGNDAFQEAYTVGLSMAATKHNYLITDASEIPQVLKEAKFIATTGRPGPVLVDIPKDILNQVAAWVEPGDLDLPGYKPTTEPNPKMVQQASSLIKKSKKPILYVGGGIIHSKANNELFELATKFNIPVVTTLMGRGAFPDGHELCLEESDDNPFLKSFYKDKQNYAFASQLHFVMQRAHQINIYFSDDLIQRRIVADFMFQKEDLFAELNLTKDEFKIFKEVKSKFYKTHPKPDLLIYLQATPERVLERVNKRARSYEDHVALEYLERLCEAYTEFFFDYSETPLLVLDVNDVDFVSSDTDYNKVVECLKREITGREFVNLTPSFF